MRATRGSSKFSTATPVGGSARHELALGPGHALQVAEELHVCHGDAGHDADVGAGHLGQPRDVPHAAGAHLEDDPARVVGRVEEGQREAQLVVEGPLAGGVLEGRREAAVEKILGRRLPDRTGDADDPAVHAVARQQAEIHERDAGVPDDDRRPADRFPCREVGGGPWLRGRRG